jgi:hypothetical protein
MSKALRASVALISVFAATIGSEATVFERVDLIPLIKMSDYVVRGTVEHISEDANLPQPRLIARIRVHEVIKGERIPSPLNVRFSGALLNKNIMSSSEGAVALSPSEEVVLFLTSFDKKFVVLTAGIQGKFIVFREDGGKKLVRSALDVLPMPDCDPEDCPTSMPLEDFVAAVQRIIALGAK